MKNKRRITGIVAAMLLAIIGTVALVGYVQSAKDKAVASEALVDVYVVDKLVPKGAEPETIKSSVSLEHVPTRLKQDGAITDLDAVGDNVAATDLQPGDQLLAARLVAKDEVSEDVKDKVQISTLLEAERAVGGSLKKGDLVGVYLSFDPFDLGEPEETTDTTVPVTDPSAAVIASDTTSTTAPQQKKSPNMTRLEFQHVLVTNVQTTDAPVNIDAEDNDATDTKSVEQVTGKQYVVTLALSPEQSERFVFATEFGHVWLSIDPATVSDDGTRLITLGNVYTVVK
jgi:pilus assembly protein CpaB